jgi:hypothetical protein
MQSMKNKDNYYYQKEAIVAVVNELRILSAHLRITKVYTKTINIVITIVDYCPREQKINIMI